MSEQVTITVDRDDLDRLVDLATGYPYEGTSYEHAANRIHAAIPAPPWEPSEAAITAYCEAHGCSDDRLVDAYHRERVRRDLIAARKRGWDACPRPIGGEIEGSGLAFQGSSAETGLCNGPGPSPSIPTCSCRVVSADDLNCEVHGGHDAGFDLTLREATDG